ncbi:MAG: undecaprenyl-phosphate glucose phosphotransferase [Flavisolibacter sp.]
MLRESSFLVKTKAAADVLFLAAIVIVTRFAEFQASFFSETISIVVAVNVFAWLFIGRAFGLYNDLRMKPISIEWVMFVKAFGIFTLVKSFLFFQLFSSFYFEKNLFFLNSVLIFFILPLQKLLIRIVFKKLRNSHNYSRKVLIVGAGENGINFYENWVNQEFGYQLTGFLDDEKQPGLNGNYLGKTTDIETVMANYELDDIVVTLPFTREKEIERIVAVGEREGKRVRIVADYHRFGNGKMHVDSVGNLSVITLRSLPLDYLDNKVYKRFFDIIFSSIAIVFVFSWLFPIISLIIKLTSKGPVLFRQERWGLNNKTITCFKFRTMVANCKNVDDEGNYLQAKKNDPRVTRIGKFLRKTNLDELPQLFNVLFGSMSLVGPRPHPIPLNITSKDSVEKYMMRHWVKPGITGWAQVHGYRGETGDKFLMKKRVKYDLWYIEKWTFWLDLQIVVQTVVNMIKGEKNAY